MPAKDSSSPNLGAQLNPNATYGLRNPKRVICTHDASGNSIFHPNPPEILYRDAVGAGALGRLYATSRTPAPLTNDADLKAYLSTDGHASVTSRVNTELVVPNGGTDFVIVTLAPGGVSQMHRTVSIDYDIVVEGEIELELDSGEKEVLRPGDSIVQRGTMHRWRNLSQDKPARFMGVLINADAFKVKGEAIKEVHIAGSGSSEKKPGKSKL